MMAGTVVEIVPSLISHGSSYKAILLGYLSEAHHA